MAFNYFSSDGDVEVTLLLDPDQTEFEVDGSASFACTVEGNPLPTKLTFSNTDVGIKAYDSSAASDSDISTNAYSISYIHAINLLALSDTSTYSCSGENNNGGIKTANTAKDVIIGKRESERMTCTCSC